MPGGSFRFVHVADLHLDSPFKGVSPQAPHVAEALRRATFCAYENAIDLCIDEQVDFMVVAGDVYDGADRGIFAQLRFRDGLERLGRAGIRAFVVHGNHDPASGWASRIAWPETVHVFGSEDVEAVPVARNGETLCHVHGISHPTADERRNLARLFSGDLPRSPFRIGLLHCNVGTRTGHAPYAPCDTRDLRATKIDYWALGHVHQRAILGESPHIVYPGNTQGRSVREAGPRGGYLVDVSASGAVTATFRPLDAVRWAAIDVPIDGVATIDALDARIHEALAAARAEASPRPVVARLRLSGRGPLHAELRRDGTLAQLTARAREAQAACGGSAFAWVERVDSDARPDTDLASMAHRDDLVGEIVRVVQACQESPTAAFEEALKPVFGSPRFRRALDGLTDEEMARLLDEAARLCIDELEVR